LLLEKYINTSIKQLLLITIKIEKYYDNNRYEKNNDKENRMKPPTRGTSKENLSNGSIRL